MTTEKQRARNARKRAKLRAHKAAVNVNSPNAVEWPMSTPEQGYDRYEFVVSGCKRALPEEIAYDIPKLEESDGTLGCFMHNYFRLPYLKAERIGLYWFVDVPKGASLSDERLKKLCRSQIEEALGFDENDIVVYIVGRP